MTKKALIKWAACKQQEALALVNERYQAALAVHNTALYAKLGIAEVAAEIHPLLSKADDLLTAWQERCRNVVGLQEYWHSLHSQLYKYTKDTNALFERLCEEEFSDTTEERKQLDQQKREMFREVETNYRNVLNNLQALETAKLGLEYLKELGFDISELLSSEQKPISTALAIPVNTRFLFLAKEETQNEN